MYYIKYNTTDPDNIIAYRVEINENNGNITEYTSQVVFTINVNENSDTYSVNMTTLPLDGAAYTTQNIFESASTSYNGGNQLSLLFNINELYVLVTPDITLDSDETVNYSTSNGLGVGDAVSISATETLYLNFTKNNETTRL